MPSFDIVSEIDLQELDNAVNQAIKEITNRYDFRGSKSRLDFDKDQKIIKLLADDDYKMTAIVEILQTKAIKRGISIKSLKQGRVEDGPDGLKKSQIDLVIGIDKEKAKELIKRLKDTKLKVQAQIQEEKIRVTGKKRDDLQEAIQTIKEFGLDIPIQFNNFRD